MRVSTAALLTTSLAMVVGSAQAQAQAPAHVMDLPPTAPAACPVDFSVRQRPGLQALRVGDRRSPGSSQYLEITFTPPDERRIESAEITVRGTDGSLRALLVATPPADVEKEFRLSREASRLSLRQFGVWVDGMSSVRWVQLRSLTFADGTVLQSSSDSTCRREPDRFVLVTAQATPAH